MCDQRPLLTSRFVPLVATGVCWLCLFATVSLPRANAQRQASAESKYELRTYEVGDLVLNIQDHPYSESLEKRPTIYSGGGGGGGGGGGFGGGGGGGYGGGEGAFVVRANNPPASTRITMDDLTRVLTTTIASQGWAVNGSGEGQVVSLGTALVVWQTQEVHKHVEELLKQIRQGSADRRTMTVDARWLLLNSDELESLLLPNQKGVPQVNREMLAKFTRRPNSIRGMTNCLSSQLVYLISGTRRNVVSSYIPVVGSLELPDRADRYAARGGNSMTRFVSNYSGGGRSVGYQPVIEKPNLGALLEIRPTLIPGESAAVVDVKSTITVSGTPPAESAARTRPDSIPPAVDRIAIETQQFATTLRLPLGKPILVGGLTHVPASMGPTENKRQGSAGRSDRASTENAQLYFILEVR